MTDIQHPPAIYKIVFEQKWLIAVFIALSPLNKELQQKIINKIINLEHPQDEEDPEEYYLRMEQEEYLDLMHDLDKIEYELTRIKRCLND